MDFNQDLSSIDIPPTWKQLDSRSLMGTLLVVGEPDSGKSTFVHYLYQRLRSEGQLVGLVDGDPGQTYLGPPTTLTAVYSTDRSENVLPALGKLESQKTNFSVWRRFIGSTTPRGHMLPMVISAQRLSETIYQQGAQTLIYDTCGLINPDQGGITLKLAKVDILQPQVIFAFQKQQELRALLTPLRRSHRSRLVELAPSTAVRRRSVSHRRLHRMDQYSSFFQSMQKVSLNWSKIAVFPWPRFIHHQVIAFEDMHGFTLSLGIVEDIDRPHHVIHVLTPLESLEKVDAIRLGDLTLDPYSFRDQLL